MRRPLARVVHSAGRPASIQSPPSVWPAAAIPVWPVRLCGRVVRIRVRGGWWLLLDCPCEREEKKDKKETCRSEKKSKLQDTTPTPAAAALRYTAPLAFFLLMLNANARLINRSIVAAEKTQRERKKEKKKKKKGKSRRSLSHRCPPTRELHLHSTAPAAPSHSPTLNLSRRHYRTPRTPAPPGRREGTRPVGPVVSSC